MIKSFTAEIHGQEFVTKLYHLMDELSQVENENIEWFKNREAKFAFEGHDKLHHHYLMHWKKNSISFGFKEEAQVPSHIQEACLTLFQKHFG